MRWNLGTNNTMLYSVSIAIDWSAFCNRRKNLEKSYKLAVSLTETVRRYLFGEEKLDSWK